jgi:hypothetical protein
MKNFKLFICIILTVILANSLAYADQVDGSSLLNSIKNNDHENIKLIDEFFDGYISGVADATVDVIWCPSHNLKGNQLQKIITKYYKAFPKDSSELSSSAKDLVLDALIDAYPCKK